MRVFHVYGKVQGVMFRKTFIYGCQKRGLRAGATNSQDRFDQVTFTIEGDSNAIVDLIKRLTDGIPINSWGALVESIEESVEPFPIEEHQVTTDNVDSISWRGGVEFYL